MFARSEFRQSIPSIPGASSSSSLRGSPSQITSTPSPRTPFRVLMVVESSAGGTGRHVMDLSEGLLARGCEVHMVYSPQRMDSTFRDRLSNLQALRHTALPMQRSIHPSEFAALLAIRRYLHSFGPFDIIHGHSSKGGALARLAALGTGVPAFYTMHGMIMVDPTQTWRKRLLYRSIERALSLVSAGIITVSPETQRAAVSLGLGRKRIIMVPNGISPMELTPRAEARKALGITNDTMAVGFIGRLVHQKAPEILVEAFARVASLLPGTRLVMVGAGPMEASLRALAGRHGIDDRILWLGHRDARTVLSAFDLLALSSRFEGLPYVLLEALAAGLPIVATTASGGELLIQPGNNGILVPPENPSALAEALIGLLSDPQRLAAYGDASRQRVKDFTLEKMVSRTLSAYASAVKKPVIDSWPISVSGWNLEHCTTSDPRLNESAS